MAGSWSLTTLDGTDWMLSIADNGVGKSVKGASDVKAGLGTSIVQALAKELDASVEIATGSERHHCLCRSTRSISRYPIGRPSNDR